MFVEFVLTVSDKLPEALTGYRDLGVELVKKKLADHHGVALKLDVCWLTPWLWFVHGP